MRPSIRYTLARLLIFLACLLLGWLLGLRDNPLVLLLVAATVSMFLSLFLLAGMREQFSADVAAAVERRQATKRARRLEDVLDDSAVEDVEAAQAAKDAHDTEATAATSSDGTAQHSTSQDRDARR